MTQPNKLTSNDIQPGPFSEHELRKRWNSQSDEFNQWDSLDSCEQLAWAQTCAIESDRKKINAIHQFAKGVEESDAALNRQGNGDSVHSPAKPTMRVRAAAYSAPSGNWAVLGFPDGEKPYSDKAMVEELFSFSPPDEDYAKVCMVDIDLPLPVLNPEEVIRAIGVEEVAE